MSISIYPQEWARQDRLIWGLMTLSLLGAHTFASTSNGIVTITNPGDGSSVATPVTVTANAVPPLTCPA